MSQFSVPQQLPNNNNGRSTDEKAQKSTDEDGDDVAVVDDETFDNIIGAIEVIVTDSKFQQRMNEFLAANAQHFNLDDDDDENEPLGSRNLVKIREPEYKHEHYQLYQQYLALGEELVEDELDKQLPDDTNLLDFYTTLERMSEEEAAERVPVEIFNLLNTFLSFEAFREQMIDYKRANRARMWLNEQRDSLTNGSETLLASLAAASEHTLEAARNKEQQQERRQRQDAAVTVEDLIQIVSYQKK